MSKLSLILKLAITAGLLLIFAVVLTIINGMVNDRQNYRSQAIASLAEGLGERQAITGLALSVPYTRQWVEETESLESGKLVKARNKREESGWIHFIPHDLNISADMALEQRYRGIHRATIFSAPFDIQSRFELPAHFGKPDRDGSTYRFGDARLTIGLGDPRGLRSQVKLSWAGPAVDFRPGSDLPGLGSGIQATLPIAVQAKAQTIDLSLKLSLAGLESIEFVPLAKHYTLKLKSPWPHPSFNGRFLPTQRTVDESGFNAQWSLPDLATGASANLLECGPNKPCGMEARFGVRLLEPVNLYSEADRATKYGLLFVALTFAALLLFEVMRAHQVHFVQYGLIGSAIAIFFLLLLALAEHIGFAQAYAAATAACVALIGVYLQAALKSVRWAAVFATLIAVLYGVLYVILQLEQHAFLFGAVLLFTALATIMWLTRKIDWYALTRSVSTTTVATPVANNSV